MDFGNTNFIFPLLSIIASILAIIFIIIGPGLKRNLRQKDDYPTESITEPRVVESAYIPAEKFYMESPPLIEKIPPLKEYPIKEIPPLKEMFHLKNNGGRIIKDDENGSSIIAHDITLLNRRIDLLEREIDRRDTHNKWLYGILLMLALGFVGLAASVMYSTLTP